MKKKKDFLKIINHVCLNSPDFDVHDVKRRFEIRPYSGWFITVPLQASSFFKSLTIFLRLCSVERPWIVVKVLRPFRCCIWMCTIPSWTALSSPLAASAKGLNLSKFTILSHLLMDRITEKNYCQLIFLLWITQGWKVNDKNMIIRSRTNG